MAKLRFVERAGKSILVIDLSGAATPERMIEVLGEARSAIARTPGKSVRALTNVTDCHFNRASVKALTDLMRDATPHMLASAAVGVTGLRAVVAQGVFSVVGRTVQLCETEEEALAWLAER